MRPGLFLVLPVDTHVADPGHGPAHERDREDLLLGHPPELDRQAGQQDEDVEKAEMVGGQDVGATRVEVLQAPDPQFDADHEQDGASPDPGAPGVSKTACLVEEADEDGERGEDERADEEGRPAERRYKHHSRPHPGREWLIEDRDLTIDGHGVTPARVPRTVGTGRAGSRGRSRRPTARSAWGS